MAAIVDFDTAIKRDQDNIDAIRRRANIRMQINDVDNALVDCNALIRLDAKDARAHSLRCFALGLEGELDEAMLACNTAVERDDEVKTTSASVSAMCENKVLA